MTSQQRDWSDADTCWSTVSISRFASPKCETDTHAEVAVTTEGNILFQAHMKIITGKRFIRHY